jgi:3-phosphoshikimate 1-carboxyvinyltransferase
LLDGDSEITITPPFESRSYIDLTCLALKQFGVAAEFSDELTITVKGNQRYQASDVSVEGDYSGAAFCDAFNLLSGSVNVTGLIENSLQGDRVYKELYKELLKHDASIDVSNCPDLAPILFALAAALNGAEFTGTKRLKIKESDRAVAMKVELEKFGADVEIYENSVTVKKCTLHKPNQMLFGHNDHRIVMALSVLLSITGGEIEGAESVTKSFPDFFLKLKSLGINIKEI